MGHIKETYRRAFIITLGITCFLTVLLGWILILYLCTTYTWWFWVLFLLYPLPVALLWYLDDMWR